MNFEETVNEKLKEAIKSGNKVAIDTYRSLRASIIEFNKSGAGRKMDDDDALKILKSAAKKRKEACELYKKGNRTELAEKEQAELEIINSFLPKQMSAEEISVFVKEKIAETGAAGMQDMGKVMGMVMKEIKDKADGSLVQKIVKETLGSM